MKRSLFLLSAAFCLHVQLFAQNSPAKPVSMGEINSKLQSWQSARVIEKAYLHFNKPYYNAGDTIYFKAYVTMGEKNELSKISGVLHVDLISKNDSLMQSMVLQLNNGLAWGDFALPAYTPRGNFRVRAYTQWMQNSGSKYVFDKIIPVNGKSISPLNTAANTNVKQADVQFFPEGGTFVNAVPSKMGLKAIGPDGLGINIKGTVVDEQNTEVAKFTSAHLGMGQFYITPQTGKTYKAKITYPNGTTSSVALPIAVEKGITLAINNESDTKLSIEINANKPYYLENKNKEINIVMFSGGVIKSVKTVLDNQVIGFDLPKKDLKTGILQVTVFSDTGMPLNERLVFIQNGNNILNLSVNTDKAVYAVNSDVKMSLNAMIGDKPSVGSFSVAAIDGSKAGSDAEMGRNILSDLLLSTDVSGYVEQPGYYFNNVNGDTRANLDILMLTQGYRRFAWKDFLTESESVTAGVPENGLVISGYVKAKDGKPFSNEKVTLLLSNSGQSLTQATDANGKFAFENLGYTDKTRFLLKLENASIKNKAVVTLNKTITTRPINAYQQPIEAIRDMPALSGNTGAEMVNAGGSKVTELKQVNVNDKTKYRTASLSGSGNADQVIFRNDIKDATNLTLALSGRVRGVKFSNGAGYLTNGTVLTQAGSGVSPMLVVIDGAITPTNLDNINPNDVQSVEILKGANASMYGVDGAKGVIVITSRQGSDNDNDTQTTVMSPGILAINPQGFYAAREFYTPRYEASRNDLSAAYWKPNVVTDKDGKATLNFNTTGAGNYVIIVEGMDSAGNIGRSVTKYKVQ
ncbi:TonB-dependent receptor [Mucilaginibacter terrenus]|uniref:TonB-dependent receptor n=1 Tax=Mucilaginibacter terrenus TaxID=2482727 RepID=A0A3E2NR41_9SPHI|nr:TonB-dependent receptor plug domain-containing protein [Mucilaginibacter terrenus]RFZ83350.1 TonB-dependent receptor [Mucilaginibacter terrenus]